MQESCHSHLPPGGGTPDGVRPGEQGRRVAGKAALLLGSSWTTLAEPFVPWVLWRWRLGRDGQPGTKTGNRAFTSCEPSADLLDRLREILAGSAACGHGELRPELDAILAAPRAGVAASSQERAARRLEPAGAQPGGDSNAVGERW